MDQNTTSHKQHAKIEAPPFSATQIAYIRKLIREEIRAAMEVTVRLPDHTVPLRPPEVK